MLVDTHCHIHEASYELPVDDVLKRAHENGVDKMIVVGTDPKSSVEAVEFAGAHSEAWAAVGVHPHEAKDGLGAVAKLLRQDSEVLEAQRIVAVGEIGLDYFYNHSPREAQIEMLNQQIELALSHDLSISFHVRDSFADFWPIIDNFRGIKGVLHSFTDSRENLEKALSRGLFVGINGIATFCKDQNQCDMYAAVPLSKLLLETDAPFLTPIPNRGKVNEPAFVRVIAEFLSALYNITFDEIAETTSNNAEALFSLK